MYEWTDPDGQVHYSDKAPDSKAEGVKRLSVESAAQQSVEPTAPQPANPGVDAWDSAWRARERQIESDRAKARATGAANARRTSDEICSKARAVLAFLEDHRNGILYRRDPNHPEITSAGRLTRFEIQDEIAKWQKTVADRCTGDERGNWRELEPRDLPFAVPAE